MFNLPLNKQEAVNRMSKRGTKSICWTLQNMTVKYEYISATQAKNWDGSPAGSGEDPSKVILQQMVWKDGNSPRFTNWW